MSEKLKPCPFCGSEAREVVTDERQCGIECSKCRVGTPVLEAVLDDPMTILRETWNRRHYE